MKLSFLNIFYTIIYTDCIKLAGIYTLQTTGTFTCIEHKYMFINQGIGYVQKRFVNYFFGAGINAFPAGSTSLNF